ncbi:hypothetical protein H4696_003252 [Amycolatopsis lexingtonensis]|uniref:Uncharacterized protein n=1 Tax=Amycolatopsis lexingtonensis TaxID=218822 RepID=A0ABR9HYZ3_9PSEU|nr:hypothetical protein [Amycolatopsis lexingtonensis]MBE1496152.1 hypothetical protein [Amycolatopsis lexingtonensis]
MDLGQVFAGVPRAGSVVGCAYCYSRSDLDLLGGDPALVPDDLVAAFAREVTDHWTQEQYGLVWRGLAPRILAVLEASPDELLLRGLAFARFSAWPAEERDAVRAALRAMLARAVTGAPPPRDVATLVCAAAHVDHDLPHWLSHLDTLPADADAGIAALARYWADDLAVGGEPSLWWFPSDPAAPIRDWLYSDALHERLSRMDDQSTLMAIARM